MDLLLHTFTPGVNEQEAEVREDVKQTIEVLREVTTVANSLADVVSSLATRMQEGELASAGGGLTFLELRNLLMTCYLKDLVSVAERKCSGASLESCRSTILRIVEMRTSLEKMRPILLKLKYRIEKLVKAANTQAVDPDDPINLKPNLQALEEEEGGKDEEEEHQVNGSSAAKSKKYVVPKVSAVPYDEDTSQAKQSKALARAKARALNSNLMDELRGEFDDAPEEISEMTVGRKKMLRELKERIRFEEDNMTRINVQKDKKRKEKSLLTIGDLGSNITKFHDVSALDQTLEDMSLAPSKRKKKRMAVASGKRKKGSQAKRFQRRK